MHNISPSIKSRFDTLKWLSVLAVLICAVALNRIYELSMLLRAILFVVAVLVAFLLALSTGKGKMFAEFIRDSRTEVRKVVWPTRQEVMQTTLIVLVATVLVGLVLWGLDAILLRVVSLLTGLGG